MRAVVLLGAGASAPFGVPTLRHLFKDAQARAHLLRNPGLAATLQDVFWGPRGRNLESSHETITVEEILTIIRDYERCEHPLPPLVPNLEEFKRSLYVLIKRAVYDGKSTTGRHLNSLIRFARVRFTHTTWASFNWDCIFESSFYYSSHTDPTPGARNNPRVVVSLVNWRNPLTVPHVFLKLHGGINWWFDNGHIHYLPFGSQPDLGQRWRDYEETKASGHPVLLEPSYYKYEDPIYELLKPQWAVLLEELMQADRVLVLGYSLPEADSMARTAMTIGFQSGLPDSKWVIVNSNAATCERYTRVFGSARVKTLAMSVNDFSTDLATHLEIEPAIEP